VAWQGHVDFVIDSKLAIQLDEPRTDGAIQTAVAVLDNATPTLVVRAHVADALPLGFRTDGSPNENGIVAITEDWPYDEKALAATVVTLNARTKLILDADIAINVAHHAFKVVDSMSPGQRHGDINDIQNTLTHELGHAVGLMHNPDDATVVMFPSAAPLEMTKRAYAQDDRAGLAALYSDSAIFTPDTKPIAIAGCSTSGGGLTLLLAALVLMFGTRRRGQEIVAVAAVLGSFAALADDARVPALAQVEHATVATVTARTSLRLPSNPGLFVTDLTLTVRDCVKGDCAATLTVRVPGGRIGELEQVVDHQPVPALDATVLVTRARATSRPQVIAVDEGRRAELRRQLESLGQAVPGSLAPQRASPTRSPTR
jgi:predicted Zn-dependent protease